MEPADTRRIQRRMEEPPRRETSAHKFARNLLSGTSSRPSMTGSETILGSDRNLLRVRTHDGPPKNPAHVREWSFAEFHAYIAPWFHIEHYFISCAAQGTQCLLCTL